ncbi:MAG TPA: cyclodeaminase/cyclohydrolase family protein [Phycisphaerales bacterium]|nr:cyclodeaminase/cyclohydrolase family protein [Phycisphaerales bacterium]
MSAIGGMKVEDLLASLATKTPTPGGGAVAGATGALGCALAGMVVSYSVGKKDLASHRERLEATGAELERWRLEFLRLGDADAEAYGKLNALQKLSPTPGDRAHAAEMAAAVEGALGVPVRCLRLSVEVVKRCLELAPITNRYLRSDLAIAGLLGEAAAKSALWNVRVNLPLIEDTARRGAIGSECEGLAARASELCGRLATACA